MNDFFEHYREILSDPAHLAVELTLMVLVDGIFLGLLWPFFRGFVERRLERQHALLDQEHGVRHHEDHVHHDDHVHPVVASPVECEDVAETP